jgi:hypothetical protein
MGDAAASASSSGCCSRWDIANRLKTLMGSVLRRPCLWRCCLICLSAACRARMTITDRSDRLAVAIGDLSLSLMVRSSRPAEPDLAAPPILPSNTERDLVLIATLLRQRAASVQPAFSLDPHRHPQNSFACDGQWSFANSVRIDRASPFARSGHQLI